MRITLVDLRTRWRAGLPFLSAVEEMRHYGVDDPYDRGYQYYEDEILCLWGITQSEVVRTWTSDAFSANQLAEESGLMMQNRRDPSLSVIVEPAGPSNINAHKGVSTVEDTDDVSILENKVAKLSGKSFDGDSRPS